jgi:hypothetical protein
MLISGRRMALFVAAMIAMTVGYVAPAAAQATRTWVSGVGDDANPCSRTAPCKTFAGAISKTAASGEINCLDPGGWGAVTITKSITIDCAQFPGGILNSSTNGIIVNAGPSDVITLRGIELNGAPVSSPGLNGIRFIAGGALIVEDLVIRGMTSSSAGAGYGILFSPSGASKLVVKHSYITNNGSGATGGGIFIQPTGTGTADAAITDTLITNNQGVGVQVNTTGNTGTISRLEIARSTVSNNANGLISVTPPSTSKAQITATDTEFGYNTGYGVAVNGATAQVWMSRITITGNNEGLKIANGGSILSFGDNVVFANIASATPTATIAKQ